MEVKGKLESYTKDLNSGKLLMTFSVPYLTEDVYGWGEKDLRLKAILWRNKRSLNSNAYLWELLGQLSRVAGKSSEELYLDYLMENPVFYKTEEGYETTYVPHGKKPTQGEHIYWFFLRTVELIQETTIQDNFHRAKLDLYARLKGSSMFDSEEMSHFLDLVIQDCRDAGIETMTPKQIQEMNAMWEADNAKNQK